MKRTLSKILCTLLVAVMGLSIAPFGRYVGLNPIGIIEAEAASISYYQTNKANVPIWSSSSSKSKKVRVVSKSGTVLKVTKKTINGSANIWYKLEDGNWVYSGNVKEHKHSYAGGKCTGNSCGYEYNYKAYITSFSASFIVVNNNGTKVWSIPYSTGSSVVKRTEPKNAVLKVTGKVKNVHGNLWYQLSDGNWVYSGDLKQRYTIKYNANGGSGAPGSQTFTDGATVKLSTTKPNRTGYTFQGWAKSSGSKEVSYKPGTSYKLSSNLTLYAVWNACTHDYSNNCGVCKKCGYVYNLKITTMSATFVVTSDNGTKVWSKPYSTGSSNNIRTLAKGSTVSIVGSAKNVHNNLWYKLSDGNWVYSGDLKQCFTIIYNANGGSGAPASQIFTDGATVKLSTTKPYRTGYTFLGWAKSSGSKEVSYKPGTSYKLSSNLTLYAVWSGCSHDYSNNSGVCKKCGNEYKLNITGMSATFAVVSDNGAKVWSKPYSTGSSSTVKTLAKGTLVNVIGSTRNAHDNLWYKLSDGNWIYSDSIQCCCKISFNANGGEGVPSTVYVLPSDSFELPNATPKRTGYQFVGWTTDLSKTEAYYIGGRQYCFDKDATLYAVWESCKHEFDSTNACKKCSYRDTVKSWDIKSVENLSQTDAQIKARVNFNKSVKCTQAGFYFGTSKDNLTKNAKYDNININGTYLDMWFLMSKYGQKLKAGTTYYYKFYVVADGVTYYSLVQSFKTKEASVVKSWDIKSIEKLSKTDAQIKARVNFNKSVKCTQAGFYFGTSKDNLKKNAKFDNINIKGTYLDMWFLMSKYGQKLKSGTTYYYKFYVVADGVTYYSSVQSFKTK